MEMAKGCQQKLISRLRNISMKTDYQLQVREFQETIDGIFASRNDVDEEGLREIVMALLDDSVQLLVSRPALGYLIDSLEKASSSDGFLESDRLANIYQSALDCIEPKMQRFEAMEARIRSALGQALIDMKRYSDAASALAGIRVLAGRHTDTEKAKHFVKVAELFLMDGEPNQAEPYVNRAGQFIHAADDKIFVNRHEVCYACILDSKGKFLEAAHRYYQLSMESPVEGTVFNRDELLRLLGKSMTCAMLSAPGPRRTRMLARLYKDARSHNFEDLFPIVEKMYHERILKRSEFHALESNLEKHQKVKKRDGYSVLESAIVEHNILAVSKVYRNITFCELAKLLGTDADRAERSCCRMITEGRLKSAIDQVSGRIIFLFPVVGVGAMDRRIEELCQSIDTVAETVTFQNHHRV